MTSGSGDAFRDFVRAVEASLVEPQAVDDIACAVHLSRSQLGRIVARLAGESPARFRRRILLERAAFRLRTSVDSVLQIALEAGYSSHEGFTRAFERAYACSPTAWRAHPGSTVTLAAPNGAHFAPPSGLRLAATERMTQMDVLTGMVDHHVWLVGEILDRSVALEDSVLDEPVAGADFIDDAPTLRSLLSRLVGQLHMWNEVIAGRSYDFSIEEHESLDSIRRRWDVQSTAFVSAMQPVIDDDRLDDTFVFVGRDAPTLYTYGGLIAHILTFGGSRRIAALATLHRHGITDLGYGDPREWIPEHLAA